MNPFFFKQINLSANSTLFEDFYEFWEKKSQKRHFEKKYDLLTPKDVLQFKKNGTHIECYHQASQLTGYVKGSDKFRNI